MLQDTVKVRLNASQKQKIDSLQRETGLNCSQILRTMIDSLTVEMVTTFQSNAANENGVIEELGGTVDHTIEGPRIEPERLTTTGGAPL